MPNKKRFDAFNAYLQPVKLSMFEVADQWYQFNIKKVLDYLEEGKRVSAEVPEEDALYYITHPSEDVFAVAKNKPDAPATEYEAIDFLNWLFAKAPWITMVGHSVA